MANIRYKLIRGKAEWSSIYVRFKHGNLFDTQVSTGLECPKERWSNSKQQILVTNEVNYKDINKKLAELSTFIKTSYENSKTEDNTLLVNNKFLKKLVDSFFNRQEIEIDDRKKLFLTDFIENFIEESRTKRNRMGKPIKPRTIQHYNTTLNKIINYQNLINIKLKITDVDLDFHDKFISYLEKKELLNNNTIGGYIDDIKLFCRNAEKKGIKISHHVKTAEFYTPKNSTNDIYLKETEIDNIFRCELESDFLDNARDWFIIGLRTGLRVSDLLKLTKESLDDEGFINIVTYKTEYPVIIPIHSQVKSILNKRNGEFPRKISSQKFNDYIKIVAEKAGLTELVDGARIDEITLKEKGRKKTLHRKKHSKYPKFELVSSHVCRRTFATNLYGKLDTLTIMKITGHSTEKQFLSYIKITPKEYAKQLKSLWEKTKSTTL